MPLPAGRLMRRENLPVALVLVASLVFAVVGLGWGIPHTMDWAIDSVAPYRVLLAGYERFSNGWWDKYPPFHLALLAILYAPYLGYLKLTGGLGRPKPVFPFGLEDPAASLGALILIARVVSVLMALGVVLLVYLTVRHLFDRTAALFAALIVGLSHTFLFYAHTANLETAYLFWSLLGVYRFVRVMDRGTLKDHLLFALFATLAVCTKDQAYGLFLLSPLPILWARFTEQPRSLPAARRWAAALTDRRNLLAGALAVAIFALVQNLPFNFSGFLKHVQFITGPGRGNYTDFPLTPLGTLGLLWETASYVADGLTLPLFAVCLVGCVVYAIRYPRRTLPVLFLAASYWLTFLNVMRMVVPRFALPMVILMAFFGGKLLSDFWREAPRRALVQTGIVAVFVYAALFATQLDYLLVRDPRYRAERWLEEHAKNGTLIETFVAPSLLNYYPRFPERVRVRASRLQAGTAWDARTPKKEAIQIPNFYLGREAPDYIVLSSFWYHRFFVEADQDAPDIAAGRRVLEDLGAGRMGYRLVANFKTRQILSWAVNDLFVNPRILIFARAS